MAAYAYFQIGENIIAKCAYYSYTESRLESIEGSGDMYESVDDFTVISYDSGWPYNVSWSDFVYAINGEKVIFLSPNEVKSKLKTSKRPMTVRFAKPISKSHYKTITTPSGEKKTKKWGDNDVCVVMTISII